jgi:hypothetical protein
MANHIRLARRLRRPSREHVRAYRDVVRRQGLRWHCRNHGNDLAVNTGPRLLCNSVGSDIHDIQGRPSAERSCRLPRQLRHRPGTVQRYSTDLLRTCFACPHSLYYGSDLGIDNCVLHVGDWEGEVLYHFNRDAFRDQYSYASLAHAQWLSNRSEADSSSPDD